MDTRQDGETKTIGTVFIRRFFDARLISVRLCNALLNNDFIDLDQVLSTPFSDFSKMPHFGKTSLDELYKFLSDIIPVEDQSRYPFFHDMSILDIPSSLFLTPINNLDLSRRTKNSLLNAGFSYLGDLNGKRKEDIKKQCKGMGVKCLSEIFDSSIIDDYVKRVEQENLIQTLSPSEQLQYCTDISGFVKNNYPSDYCDLFFGRYNGKLTEILPKYDITRQRAYQKTNKVLEGIKNGFSSKEVAPFILEAFSRGVKDGIKLDNGNDIDSVISNSGVASIISAIFPSLFVVVKLPSMNNSWAFDPFRNIKKEVTTLKEYLDGRVYCKKEELLENTNLSYGFIKDLSFVYEYGDYFSNCMSENKFKVLKYIDDNRNRIFTIQEICDEYNLGDRYVRSLLLRRFDIINVGLSKYAVSENRGVENGRPYKTLDIIIDILNKEGKPINKEHLISEVLKIRDINRSSVIQAIYSNSDHVIEIDGGMLALTKWGYKQKELSHITYENKVQDVVLEILESSYFPLTIKEISKEIANRYGDSASDNIVSIHAALQKLKQEYPLVQSMHGSEASYFLDK